MAEGLNPLPVFVADFERKYGYTPAFYGAQSYDGMMLIDSAVRLTKGRLADTKAVVRAMRNATISLRMHFPGTSRFSTFIVPWKPTGGHLPIQIQPW